MTTENIISIITVVLTSTVVSTLVLGLFERNKKKAETDNMILDGAKALVKPLTERVDELELQGNIDRETITRMDAQLAKDRSRIAELEAQGYKDRARIAELEAGAERDGRKIATLESMGISNTQTIGDLRMQLAAKDREIADLQEAVRVRDSRIAELGAELVTLRAQLKTLSEKPKRGKTGELPTLTP